MVQKINVAIPSVHHLRKYLFVDLVKSPSLTATVAKRYSSHIPGLLNSQGPAMVKQITPLYDILPIRGCCCNIEHNY